MLVTAQGQVRDALVVRSAGCAHLDRAARKAALGYEIEPAYRGAEAIDQRVLIEIRFK